MNESLVTLSTKRSATLKMWSELKCSRLAYKIEAHKILLRQFFRDFLFDEPTGAGVTLDSTGTSTTRTWLTNMTSTLPGAAYQRGVGGLGVRFGTAGPDQACCQQG
eukprot:7250369-Pyramimonas_sp.AAC.1